MKSISTLNVRFFVCTILIFIINPTLVLGQAPVGYYSTIDETNPTTLRNSIHNIIDDHTRYPYTSSAVDTWDVLEIADEDQDNAGNVITIYQNDTNAKEGGGNTFYNREHSWPKSYGFPNDGSTNYPYTDMHHLFIADSGYNSSRSNKPYDYCISGCAEKVTLVNNSRGGPGISNWTAGSFTQGMWEVWQGRKGDVARALMYMDVRYEGGTHGVTGVAEPDLILTDDLTLIENSNAGSNLSTAYMGLLSVLITWHNDDPVDLIELQHAEAVYSFQGNRNPFVDHPEWVECVFELVCNGGGTDTTAPSQVSGLSAVANTSTIDLDWFDNTEADLAGYDVYRSQTSGSGYVKINSNQLSLSAYADSSITGGTTYYYVVTASDITGNESINSNQVTVTAQSSGGGTSTAWINEIHYDNKGKDRNESVEIAGPAGTDVSGWTLDAYNGSTGLVYDSISLSGTIAMEENCMGTLAFDYAGLQNGSPDGVALVDSVGQVLDFISYEGSFTANDGAANGLVSHDINVSETASTSRNHSLQLGGTGSSAADFTWQSAQSATNGNVNSNQVFDGCGADTTAPSAPLNLSANASDAQVALTWQANTENDLAGYHLLRSTSPGGSYTQVNGSIIVDTLYFDTSVNNGTTYYYVLNAVDSTGNVSTNSSEVSATPTAPVVSSDVWINEIHYDNDSTDVGEFVEIAGGAGIDISGWQILLYNGSGGAVYKTVNLSGVIPNQQNSFGTIPFDISGIQNGAPDGLALVDAAGVVIEFLSYEGTLTAVDGAAAGMTSVNIGVSETGSTPAGYSLQRAGSGIAASDFVFTAPQSETYGLVNTGQSF
ncbi:endonuclease [Marinicella litoralis]|uniref:Endonuclease I n=1 Tax=Marinicella litoralis TaxID=644220 RepID=A0A4R6XRH2_9GAMM|nr:endonuclease [Marinicella litoralis]TDR20497.1 endonuclease I [Marinicella litoralis]